MKTNQSDGSTVYHKMLSACSGALITSLLVTPLDVVKTRLQSQPAAEAVAEACTAHMRPATFSCPEYIERGGPPIHGHCRPSQAACLCAPPPREAPSSMGFFLQNELGLSRPAQAPLRGTWDGLVTIMRHEGPWTLWRGLLPTLAMSVPSTIMYYVGYEHIRDFLMTAFSDSAYTHQYAPLISGGMMRAVTATVISPLELVRTQMQSHGETPAQTCLGVLRGVAHMMQREGPRSLWRGLEPTLWRDVPFSGKHTALANTAGCVAVYWLGYESIKRGLARNNHEETGVAREFQNAFLAGAASGMIASVLTTPFDVAKTRMQVQDTTGHRQSKSMLHVLRTIAQQEGMSGLTRGITARVAKVAPSCAIMIGCYEVGKRWFVSHG
ncbi:mitochondrial carrier domain-containing protein [Thamnocephalis sphaerospora]|uniref:Mitochondrial carrier domain-containing protein n=1 Tax=Thamnocephalis sphaerospora TaxID=78915 RepID=A0A4P9XMQ5_9FUNG|nr:mitochondrial carrier domain-containing protein [Thamnocephalis sphaerospora]|eukprot:RKP07198.1 mitochondrial carrier domain-containing protein [Thamnocephalis sphaerospora]